MICCLVVDLLRCWFARLWLCFLCVLGAVVLQVCFAIWFNDAGCLIMVNDLW